MSDIIDKLRSKNFFSRFIRVAVLLIIITAVFTHYYELIRIDGPSMVPTYRDGQWVLMRSSESLDKDWRPQRYDVIVIWCDETNELICKRVLGLPGETVEIRDGVIYIDDNEVFDTFSLNANDAPWIPRDSTVPILIPAGTVWVVGDNREESIFGSFLISKIRGKIVLY